MEAAKEDTISHYLPILDNLIIKRTTPKEGQHYITDLCILFHNQNFKLCVDRNIVNSSKT